MDYRYTTRKKPGSKETPGDRSTTSGPSMDALRAGLANPSAEQMGHRIDFPDAIRAKMEASFGTDFSQVKLYESETVAEAGAQAVARGSDVAFAPGLLSFGSTGGQELLGHELSHVAAQSRGEVSGNGFLNDQQFEARADREGALAAAGRSISAIPATAPLSPASAAPAAGPMQAKKARQIPMQGIGPSFDYALSADPQFDGASDDVSDDGPDFSGFSPLAQNGLRTVVPQGSGAYGPVSREEQQGAMIQELQATIQSQRQEIIRLRQMLENAGIDTDDV